MRDEELRQTNVKDVNDKVDTLGQIGRRDAGADAAERRRDRRRRPEGPGGAELGRLGAPGGERRRRRREGGARARRAKWAPKADEFDKASKRLVYTVVISEDEGQFKFGKAALPDDAKAKLDELVTKLKADPNGAYFEIEGHTDALGPKAVNEKIGLERAEAVKRYLFEQHQIPLHRMNVISYGMEKPVASNKTRKGARRIAASSDSRVTACVGPSHAVSLNCPPRRKHARLKRSAGAGSARHHEVCVSSKEIGDKFHERVLIVEDDAAARVGLEQLIRSWGFAVEAAGDGDEALEKVGVFRPGIVLTDLVMPQMGGLELLRALQEQGEHTTTVILTAQGTVETAVAGHQAGRLRLPHQAGRSRSGCGFCSRRSSSGTRRCARCRCCAASCASRARSAR